MTLVKNILDILNSRPNDATPSETEKRDIDVEVDLTKMNHKSKQKF